MKSFIVVFAICIAGALAGITDEQKAKLREHKVACVAETGVTEEVIAKLKGGEPVVFDDKLNCFSACMLKRIGIMRPDGSIDEQVARAKIPKDLPQDKVDQVIDACKVQVGKDTCETGGKVLSCLSKTKAVALVQ
ncbi:general odorant-binding protein 56a-like [Phymastichus coffea]|uniref:general odorant-binding protein 56a-like n=1 Tax=Phymastichus coffea TaxID=108790 RepID=UPI00273B0F89|nr:general odorant-binding protein 56a-like [Phymastichus coffea]